MRQYISNASDAMKRNDLHKGSAKCNLSARGTRFNVKE